MRILPFTASVMALALISGCGPFESDSGKSDNKNPDPTTTDPTTDPNWDGETNAGTNSGATGPGPVPGIDCEGVCSEVVKNPPHGDSTVTGAPNTTPQTYVPTTTPVSTQCFRGTFQGQDSVPMVKVKHSVTEGSDGKVVTAL